MPSLGPAAKFGALFFGATAFVAAVAGVSLTDWAVEQDKESLDKTFEFGVVNYCTFVPNENGGRCCFASETKFCENFDDSYVAQEGCAAYDRLQSSRAFSIAHVILSGVALLALLANHHGNAAGQKAAIAASTLAGALRRVAPRRAALCWPVIAPLCFDDGMRFCLRHASPLLPFCLARGAPHPTGPVHITIIQLCTVMFVCCCWCACRGSAGVFGTIAFAVFIDLKVLTEKRSTDTFVKYETGFGLFTGAFLASYIAAGIAFTLKPKSLAAELGSDIKAAL